MSDARSQPVRHYLPVDGAWPLGSEPMPPQPDPYEPDPYGEDPYA